MSDTKTKTKASSKAASLPAGLESDPQNAGLDESQVTDSVDASFNFETSKEGEVFGGSYPRLELTPGDCSVALIYMKDTEIPLDDGVDDKGLPKTKMQTVYVAETPKGALVSCPIAAIFMKHFKEADIQKGDTFRIQRYVDATKKRGKGSGNKMQVYAVMVTARAEPVS